VERDNIPPKGLEIITLREKNPLISVDNYDSTYVNPEATPLGKLPSPLDTKHSCFGIDKKYSEIYNRFTPSEFRMRKLK
jgi:hypothetical protein